jgi:hypothetical protein
MTITRRLPTTPSAVLVEVEHVLLDAIARWDDVRAILLDALPGMSGAASGTGVPSGGGGFVHSGPHASASVVERVIETGVPREQQILDRLDALPARVHTAVTRCVTAAGGRHLAPTLSGRRLLIRCHLEVRVMIDHGLGRSVQWRDAEALHQVVVELGQIIEQWGSAPSTPNVQRDVGLAADTTEMWCRSCLRVGAREPRSDRYPVLGVCRWCGDFHATEAVMPALELLDARHSGKRITAEMVARARPAKKAKRRRR